MSLSSLITLAGPAVGTLSKQTAGLIEGGFDFIQSFVSEFAKQNESSDAEQGKFVSINDRESALASIRQASTVALKRLHEALSKKLTDAEIDTSRPIDLRQDGLGSIVVANGHPNRAAIEQVIGNDAAINELFIHLTSIGAILQSVDQEKPVNELDVVLRVTSNEIQFVSDD